MIRVTDTIVLDDHEGSERFVRATIVGGRLIDDGNKNLRARRAVEQERDWVEPTASVDDASDLVT